MGINYKGSQDQTERAVALEEEEVWQKMYQISDDPVASISMAICSLKN
jgi:hypothetical protein